MPIKKINKLQADFPLSNNDKKNVIYFSYLLIVETTRKK